MRIFVAVDWVVALDWVVGLDSIVGVDWVVDAVVTLSPGKKFSIYFVPFSHLSRGRTEGTRSGSLKGHNNPETTLNFADDCEHLTALRDVIEKIFA